MSAHDVIGWMNQSGNYLLQLVYGVLGSMFLLVWLRMANRHTE